jgi:hypothetical protein
VRFLKGKTLSGIQESTVNRKHAWKMEMIKKITHFGRIYTKTYLPWIPDQVRNDGVVVVSVDEREHSYHGAFLNGGVIFIMYTQETAEPFQFPPVEPVV